MNKAKLLIDGPNQTYLKPKPKTEHKINNNTTLNIKHTITD